MIAGASAFRIAAIAALAAPLALATDPGRAQAASGFFVPLWTLDPIGTFTVRDVPSGETVAKTAMRPATMYVLAEAYADDRGKPVAPAGMEMIALKTVTRAACAIYPPRPTGAAAILKMGMDRHLCLVDADADGRFDRHFYKGHHEAGFFNLAGTMPRTLKPGTGGRYGAVDPQAMARPLTWSVTFGICDAKRKRCTINTSLSVPGFDGKSMGPVVVSYGKRLLVDVASGSGSFEFLGSRFGLRPQGENVARFTLESDFDPKPRPLF